MAKSKKETNGTSEETEEIEQKSTDAPNTDGADGSGDTSDSNESSTGEENESEVIQESSESDEETPEEERTDIEPPKSEDKAPPGAPLQQQGSLSSDEEKIQGLYSDVEEFWKSNIREKDSDEYFYNIGINRIEDAKRQYELYKREQEAYFDDQEKN